MRFLCVICGLCLVLVAAGCGSDEGTGAELETSSQPQVFVGNFPQEGPFAAISRGKTEEKPRIEPPDRPPPNKLLTRDLVVGSGPAAKHGDEVGIYYAYAFYRSGNMRFSGWPPEALGTFRLGFGPSLAAWEKSIEGMKVGGLREVILPIPRPGRAAIDYVIKLVTLKQAKEKSGKAAG